jgi:hypothetical protein
MTPDKADGTVMLAQFPSLFNILLTRVWMPERMEEEGVTTVDIEPEGTIPAS